MGELISGGPFGWALYLLAFSSGMGLVALLARRNGLLGPVVVGIALRAAVLVAVHVLSVGVGDEGLLFNDAADYLDRGTRIAAQWSHGNLVNPADPAYAGSAQFGYWAFVATIFVAVGKNLLAAKLANLLLSAAAILLTGLVARDLLGQRAARRAAWFVALAPTLVWWSVPLLKEVLVLFLVVTAVLCALRLDRGWGYATGLVATVAGLAVTRATAVLAVGLGILIAYAAAAYLHRRELGWTRLLVRVAAVMAATSLVLAGVQQENDLVSAYADTFGTLRQEYRGGETSLSPVDVGRTLAGPLPWSFDETTHNWYRGLYPGQWFLYALYPLAALGVWRMRRRPELALVVVPVVVLIGLGTVSTGFALRVRSGVEPLIIVLAVAGMRSWRHSVLPAAAALAVIAVVAAVHQGSLLWLAGLLAAAGLVTAGSRFLPDHDLRDEPSPSPIESALTPSRGIIPPAGRSDS